MTWPNYIYRVVILSTSCRKLSVVTLVMSSDGSASASALTAVCLVEGTNNSFTA